MRCPGSDCLKDAREPDGPGTDDRDTQKECNASYATYNARGGRLIETVSIDLVMFRSIKSVVGPTGPTELN